MLLGKVVGDPVGTGVGESEGACVGCSVGKLDGASLIGMTRMHSSVVEDDSIVTDGIIPLQPGVVAHGIVS